MDKEDIFAIVGVAVICLVGVFAICMAIRTTCEARTRAAVVCNCPKCTQKAGTVYYMPTAKTATVLRKTLEGRNNIATKLRLDDGTERYVNLSDSKVKNVQLLDRGDKITYSLDGNHILIYSIQWSGDTGKVQWLSNGLRLSTVTHAVRTGRGGGLLTLRLEDGTCDDVDRTDSEDMGNDVLSLQKGDKIYYSLNKYGSIIVHSIQWNN